MSPTDIFIRQLEALRPDIDHAYLTGKRIRVKLYCSDRPAPAQFQAYIGQVEPLRATVSPS